VRTDLGATPSAIDEDGIYLNPLAYLLGLEGAALMRAFAGEYDAAFVEQRIDEVRRLLADRELLGAGAQVRRLTVEEGYDAWSTTYDDPGNGLLAPDFERVTALADGAPSGRALDAACGTGRYAEWLAEQGCQVVAVDRSEGMLAVARDKLNGADIRLGDLSDLPVESETIDLVICALALTHAEDLTRPYRELSRVLRPGGRLVVSDTHSLFLAALRYPLVMTLADGSLGYLPGWEHSVADHLTAALEAGLVVSRVAELTLDGLVDADVARLDLADEPVPDPWALMTWAPAATNAAYRGTPRAVYLQLHRPDAAFRPLATLR